MIHTIIKNYRQGAYVEDEMSDLSPEIQTPPPVQQEQERLSMGKGWYLILHREETPDDFSSVPTIPVENAAERLDTTIDRLFRYADAHHIPMIITVSDTFFYVHHISEISEHRDQISTL